MELRNLSVGTEKYKRRNVKHRRHLVSTYLGTYVDKYLCGSHCSLEGDGREERDRWRGLGVR